jgi:hypothetical protein
LNSGGEGSGSDFLVSTAAPALKAELCAELLTGSMYCKKFFKVLKTKRVEVGSNNRYSHGAEVLEKVLRNSLIFRT